MIQQWFITLWEWFKLVIDPVNWSWSTFNCNSKLYSRSIWDIIGFTITMQCAYLYSFLQISLAKLSTYSLIFRKLLRGCLWCEFVSTLCCCRRFGLFSHGWLMFSRCLFFSLSVLFPMFDKEKRWIGGEEYQMLDEDDCAWRLGSLANFTDHSTVEETLNSQYLYRAYCQLLINKRKTWSVIQVAQEGASTIQKQFSFPWFTSLKISFLNFILNCLLNWCELNPTIQYWYISLADYPILSGWHCWTSWISMEYSFGVSITSYLKIRGTCFFLP